MLEKSPKNIGSICKMRIVHEDDVASMPFAYKGSLFTAPVLQEGKNWEPLIFTRDTAHFVESFDGQHYNLVVKFRSPKNQPNSLEDLDTLKNGRWIVEFTDLNGYVNVAGVPKEACAIRDEIRDFGQNKRDSNHFNCIILLSRSERVPILTA